MNTIQIKPGKYIIGDPCYCFGHDATGHEKWLQLLDNSDYFTYGEGELDNFTVIAFNTLYGDGEYFDNFGNKYGVDSGMIGLVPWDLYVLLGKQPIIGTDSHLIIFSEEAEARSTNDQGYMYFGQYRIDTGQHDLDPLGDPLDMNHETFDRGRYDPNIYDDDGPEGPVGWDYPDEEYNSDKSPWEK